MIKGESYEENVRREVAEEVGLNILHVEYCTSQPWASPSCQLSLGCIATVSEKNFIIDPKEIQDAKWVKANVLKEAVERTRTLKKFESLDPEVNQHEKIKPFLRQHNFKLNL